MSRIKAHLGQGYFLTITVSSKRSHMLSNEEENYSVKLFIICFLILLIKHFMHMYKNMSDVGYGY